MEDVVDLGEIKERADKRDKALAEVAEAQQRERILETARTWDAAMTRAFKGIMPAPTRRAMLSRAVLDED